MYERIGGKAKTEKRLVKEGDQVRIVWKRTNVEKEAAAEKRGLIVLGKGEWVAVEVGIDAEVMTSVEAVAGAGTSTRGVAGRENGQEVKVWRWTERKGSRKRIGEKKR